MTPIARRTEHLYEAPVLRAAGFPPVWQAEGLSHTRVCHISNPVRTRTIRDHRLLHRTRKKIHEKGNADQRIAAGRVPDCDC
jgi:hypothetical protein